MAPIVHDFRSDTVTRPSDGMRAAMAAAPVGDDVFGDDPTVLKLEATLAERLGKPAAVFMPSGTQSNLAALMAHCGRGEAFICGMDAHVYAHEQGGAAWLGGLLPQPLPHEPDGTVKLADIEAAIWGSDDVHVPLTRLLSLENTFGGRVMPAAFLDDATGIARDHGLSTHLDGARVFNAAIAGNRDVAEIAKPFDTISVCLSKGLGTPVGTVLVGEVELIRRARRHRKALGGGLRQAGILAAAGLYALEFNVDRLRDDHARARRLSEGLATIEALRPETPQTNIIWVDVDAEHATSFARFLAEEGIGITSGYGSKRQRWVTHLDVGDAAIEAALEAARRYFRA